MNNRNVVLSTIFGGIVGLAIGLPVKFYFLDPYLASLNSTKAVPHENRQAADNLHRDQMVAESIEMLDARSKKAACEGYIGGLNEQGLSISAVIKSACKDS